MGTGFDTVIIGAGNAGVSLAARLRRDGRQGIALIDPSPVHRYRPMLNYVAAAKADMRHYDREMATVVPEGVELLPHAATSVDPDAHTVTVSDEAGDRTVGYRDLVICPGLTPDWDAIPGLYPAYRDGWAASAHVPEYVGRACAALVRVRRGRVVFSVPPEPASCGGTVLKVLFMACDAWRHDGVLDRVDVHLVAPFRGVLGLGTTDARLQASLSLYGVTVHDRSTVSAVDHATRAVRLAGPGATTLEDVALAYVTPHSRAPGFIAESGLAAPQTDGTGRDRAGHDGTGHDGAGRGRTAEIDDAGLVAVDPRTLRHVRSDSVWGLGDAATVGTRPSGGALREQVRVLADNMRAAREGGGFTHYDGYTVIPVTVSRDALLLAEFDGTGRPAPSVRGIDLTVPRRATYFFDRYVQPVVYFRRLLRGRV